MALDELARRLWTEHLEAPFPARLRGEEVAGIDMVMLDARRGWLRPNVDGNSLRLDEPHRRRLAQCLGDLDRVLALMHDPAEHDYYERLRRLARLALT